MEAKERLPWVEILFFLFLLFAAAAFYSRGLAHLRWVRGQSMGSLGAMSWAWALAAFGPFLALVSVAPNPELSGRVPRAQRRRQVLMFTAIGILFFLELSLMSF